MRAVTQQQHVNYHSYHQVAVNMHLEAVFHLPLNNNTEEEEEEDADAQEDPLAALESAVMESFKTC